jgi:hypothetical protein
MYKLQIPNSQKPEIVKTAGIALVDLLTGLVVDFTDFDIQLGIRVVHLVNNHCVEEEMICEHCIIPLHHGQDQWLRYELWWVSKHR